MDKFGIFLPASHAERLRLVSMRYEEEIYPTVLQHAPHIVKGDPGRFDKLCFAIEVGCGLPATASLMQPEQP